VAERDGVTAMVIRVPTELHAAVKAHAQQTDRGMAVVIRRALREYLDNHKDDR
jgi:predicted transcriptional regulator